LAALFVLVILKMPAPHASPYGEAINQLASPQRHVTDAVTAVNFDYRGFDTLGEEFILFISVMGAIVLLREAREKKHEERPDAIDPRRVVGSTDAVRVWTLAMTGPTVLLGLYIVIHGQLTPGGGFQGGVILATAPLLIYLVESYNVFKSVTSNPLIEITEAVGAGGYAVIGILGCIMGSWFLQDVLPLGEQNQPNLLSGGTVPLINLSVGIEVAAGFTLLLAGFLQTLLAREKEK
jgi:multicomponent Na+:H+ antiporter subunit B